MNYQSLTAKILINIKAINFNFKKPYILTSGKKSPVYVDCRKIISFTKERNQIMDITEKYFRKNKIKFDILAGGETAGIPYAAILADRLKKPMIYIRKKPKGFGKNSQIEGDFKTGQKAILIEDLATDGGSKVKFIKAMKKAKLKVKDTFVIFYYGLLNQGELTLNKLGINIHYLCTWHNVLNEIKKGKILQNKDIESIEKFLFEPNNWKING